MAGRKVGPASDPDCVVFDFKVIVHGCSNIPMQSSAKVSCKWKMLTSTTAGKIAGMIPSAEVTQMNLVVWDAEIPLLSCSMKMDKTSCVQVDLAEFAGMAQQERTYLLQDSRFNSTLTLSVHSEQVSGDVLYRRRGLDCSPISTDVERSRGKLYQRRLSWAASDPIGKLDVQQCQVYESNTVYQVVDDILRISEGYRTSRASSAQLDTLPG